VRPVTSPPRNPFLADSCYAMAHGRCDQQDNSPVAGPAGPTRVLTDDDVDYEWLGPGHFGGLISSPYPDGRRVIWSNGRQQIVKLDYGTLRLRAAFPVSEEAMVDVASMEQAVAALDERSGDAAIGHAVDLTLQFMTGLDGVYSALDRDNTLFVGRKSSAVAYAEANPSDPASPIVEKGRWEKPADITGLFVGVNMTFDGNLVLTTDHGWVVCLARDFSWYDAVQLRHSEIAADWCAEQAAARGNTAYGWVRTSCCVDDGNGVYVSSRDHTHKVVWTGSRLSIDEADGAWTAEYSNGTGNGSGTTPSLMGFGGDDRFVVIGDGDRVVNITLLWRDEIPSDWQQLPNAPSRRIAGIGPANMGKPDLEDIQTEQSITVSGWGAMTVNNDPPTMPAALPETAKRMLPFFLGHDPAYTPHGLHKYEWDPGRRELREAWINTEVSSPNSVPFVSEGADLVYTCGVRDRRWTIEAVNWTTGESAFHYVVGGSKFNTLGSGITLDEEGRLLYGTIFGKVRIKRWPAALATA
jgi:hypothetical protein